MGVQNVCAAVLIGGKSRRMGQPKALIRLDPAGPTMLERVVNALEQTTQSVILVGTPDWNVPDSLSRLQRVDDKGWGAVQGVMAVLRTIESGSCVVVGCDMPFLSPPLLQRLIARSCELDRGVYCIDDDAHPLHAVYRREDIGEIEARWQNGERSLMRVVRAVGMVPVRANEESDGEAGRWSTFNVNTPAELKIARDHVRTVQSR